MHRWLAGGTRARLFVAIAIAITASVTGCGDPSLIDGDSGIRLPDAGPPPDGPRGFEDGGRIGRDGLEIARVVPDHGPFTGGNTVVLRGNGFTEESRVRFGDITVLDPQNYTLIDEHRLEVLVPAGRPGPVEVSVANGDNRVSLADGYTYETIEVTPRQGSTAGGTLISIVGTGTNFEAGDRVTVGFGECTEIEVVSTTRINCRTPAGDAGAVDVTVEGVGGRHEAPDSFSYFESGDPNYGGFGGGPIDGSINVLVVDAERGFPLPDAYVLLGDGLESARATDETGRVAFNGPQVVAPATIHVAKTCYSRASFVAFDAAEVTAFLIAIPGCIPPENGEPPPNRNVERNLAVVQGQLVWQGDFGTGVQPWFNLPEPRAGWVRVAYVYTTQSAVGVPNPNPALVGPQRVLEENPGARGYPYAISARPGGFAVYALAGLEHPASGRFIPYLLGVHRNLLVGPGDRLIDIDIDMNIPLDHYLETTTPALAPEARPGTDRFVLQANIDLGGEGVIVPMTAGRQLDSYGTYLLGDRVRVHSQPSLEGSLADGRYRIEFGWYGPAANGVDVYNPQPASSPYDHVPFTKAVLRGVNRVDATIELPALLSVPMPLAPTANGRLPTDRVLRWRSTGADPSFFLVTMTAVRAAGPFLFGVPVWQYYAPGNTREVAVPHVAQIPGVGEQLWSEPGYAVTLTVEAGVIPGAYDFDNFTYLDQNPAQWSHHARNTIPFTP